MVSNTEQDGKNPLALALGAERFQLPSADAGATHENPGAEYTNPITYDGPLVTGTELSAQFAALLAASKLDEDKKAALADLSGKLAHLPPEQQATMLEQIKSAIDGAINVDALKAVVSDFTKQIEIAHTEANAKESLTDSAIEEQAHKKEMLRIVEELHAFNEKMDTIFDALEGKLTPEEKKARDEAKADLKAKEEELKRILEDPNSTEEERNAAFKRLMISQNHLIQIDKPILDRLAQSPDPEVREQAQKGLAIVEARKEQTAKGEKGLSEREAHIVAEKRDEKKREEVVKKNEKKDDINTDELISNTNAQLDQIAALMGKRPSNHFNKSEPSHPKFAVIDVETNDAPAKVNEVHAKKETKGHGHLA